MAATFIVENGSGLANANAYADVLFLNQYHDDRTGAATWNPLATADKEKAIRLATFYIDAVYGRRWHGIRRLQTQALDWPRTGAYDLDGYLQSESEIPVELKEATAEAAFKTLGDVDLLPDISEPGEVTSESVQVGPISISTDWAAGKSQTVLYRKLDRLLARWLRSSNILVRA